MGFQFLKVYLTASTKINHAIHARNCFRAKRNHGSCMLLGYQTRLNLYIQPGVSQHFSLGTFFPSPNDKRARVDIVVIMGLTRTEKSFTFSLRHPCHIDRAPNMFCKLFYPCNNDICEQEHSRGTMHCYSVQKVIKS